MVYGLSVLSLRAVAYALGFRFKFNRENAMTKISIWSSVCVVAAAISLSACGTITPAPADISQAYFGKKPSPTTTLNAFKARYSATLKDPASAIYECGDPRRGWTNRFGNIAYGWIVYCSVNAKNSYGAYVGARPYGLLFRDDQIVHVDWANAEYVD